ncbi:MAG TPA: nucleotidyltransferase family protein, partial [Candidatus Acidoferrales bacterium]|nr:nucleotidyltransferase family protein [Candidatus Acidoferrales bacterium]
FHLNVVRNRHLSNELIRFMRAFQRAGVRALTFKGPLLAELAYGDVGLRQFSDIDFLIDAHDLAAVAEILTGAGYTSHLDRRDGLTGGYFQEFEECFNGRDGLGAVDVHWTMTPGAYPFAPSEIAVRSRATEAVMLGEAVPTLAPDDLFLYLCVHGAKHGWCQLGWICDVAQLLAVPGLIDVPTVLERAAPLGSRRMVLLALYLAHAIDGVVAEDLLDEARRTQSVAATGEYAMRTLFRRLDGSLPLFDPWRVPVAAIEGVAPRANYVVRRLMAPTMGDFQMLPLPEVLFPLYWVIRPFRMALQYGPRLVRGVVGGAASTGGTPPR